MSHAVDTSIPPAAVRVEAFFSERRSLGFSVVWVAAGLAIWDSRFGEEIRRVVSVRISAHEELPAWVSRPACR